MKEIEEIEEIRGWVTKQEMSMYNFTDKGVMFTPKYSKELKQALQMLERAMEGLERICKGSAYEIGWDSDGKDYGVAVKSIKDIHAMLPKESEK